MIESLTGIGQVVVYIFLNGGNLDSATGDIVQGTLNPLSFLYPGGNFNNQIFTTNLLLMLLFYTPSAVTKRKGVWVCVIGFLAIIFASMWHLFLAFLFSAVMMALYFSNPLKIRINLTRLAVILFSVCIILLSIITQPKNFSLISHYLEKVTSGDSPKTAVAVNSLTQLPTDYPWVYFVGLGPGQYSSRAGLIGTGKYFGEFTDPIKLPLLDAAYSKAFEKYIYPSWKEVATNVPKYGNSTMARPFFSVLSIIIELGYPMFIFLLIGLTAFIIRVRRLYKKEWAKGNSLNAGYAYSCGVLVLFFFVFSFFENYMELTQAIFVGLLMFKYFYSYAKDKSSYGSDTME